MIRYLADTHIAIWWLEAPEKLTHAQRDVLGSDAMIYLSLASIWEMAIKASLGKLTPPRSMTQTFEDRGFDILPIQPAHAEHVLALPYPDSHRDPFDRMLIAQAQVEGLTLLTSDAKFALYDVAVV